MFSTRIRGRIMPTRNKPQKINACLDQPRPQGFSLKKWVGPPIFWGKSPGDEVVSRPLSIKQAVKIMHIFSVIIYPLEKKFIGTSSINTRWMSCVAHRLHMPGSNWNSSDFPSSRSATTACMSLLWMFSLSSALISSTPSKVPVTSAICLI